jgi:hypothetical protein
MSSIPNGSGKLPTHETPAIVRRTASSSYHTGGLESARSAVLDDLGHWIPEVPVSFMLQHIVPPVDVDLEAIKNRLRSLKQLKGERWKDFQTDPTKSAAHENQVFKPLEGLFRSITQCLEASEAEGSSDQGIQAEACNDKGDHENDKDVTEHHQRGLVFFSNPNRAPYSKRSNDTRPDSYFVRPMSLLGPSPKQAKSSESASPLHRWDDIALSAEYKKNSLPEDLSDVNLFSLEKRRPLICLLRMHEKYYGACITFCAVTRRGGSRLALPSRTRIRGFGFAVDP